MKSVRVAVASRDGKTVHLHFGHASQFLVFELGRSSFRFLETKPCEPVCQGGVDPEHTPDRVALAVDALGDCAAVVVARIGPGPRSALERRGIRVYQLPGFIDEALGKIAPELLS